jgi:hypothetical protein
MCIAVYVYSAHMTSVDPNNNLWGYICTFVFAVLSIWSVNLYTKYSKKDEKNSEES